MKYSIRADRREGVHEESTGCTPLFMERYLTTLKKRNVAKK